MKPRVQSLDRFASRRRRLMRREVFGAAGAEKRYAPASPGRCGCPAAQLHS
jgi:hypothetical protein